MPAELKFTSVNVHDLCGASGKSVRVIQPKDVLLDLCVDIPLLLKASLVVKAANQLPWPLVLNHD